ncbi:MAG TPA: fluoride efflux transporter CrcB [Longimicrobium sp.]|nr:fluoride efflux transporter CrcB [Longimicrobium sp.]
METPRLAWLLVALGGAAGAVARFGVARWAAERWAGPFPWGTFAVNVAGSLVLGFLLGAFPAPDAWRVRTLLGVGFCGGLTTFSTFAYEAAALLQARDHTTALAYAAASLAAALLAVFAGLALGARLAG